MKHLSVKRVRFETEELEKLSQVMDNEGVEYNEINTVNWANYPYCPNVSFRIAYTEDNILLHFVVQEDTIRAKYENDNGQVWTDSCVEFFLLPADDGVYYNIETNCIGTVLVGAGTHREGREHAPLEITRQIKRYATLGNQAFAQRKDETGWELSLAIPLSVFFKHQLGTLQGKSMNANFYKCGDELETQHFVSWNRIEIDSPDFHRPDFFGELSFI